MSMAKCREDMWTNLKALWVIWVPTQVCTVGRRASSEVHMKSSKHGRNPNEEKAVERSSVLLHMTVE